MACFIVEDGKRINIPLKQLRRYDDWWVYALRRSGRHYHVYASSEKAVRDFVENDWVGRHRTGPLELSHVAEVQPYRCGPQWINSNFDIFETRQEAIESALAKEGN